MLSERQLQNLLKVFEERMQDITEDYLTRMGKHLRDIGRLTDTDVHRVIQMKRVNKNLEHIKARIARAASMSIKDVERVFEAVAESDYRFAATTFGEDHAPRVKDNKYLERIIKAQLRATAQEFKNLSQTTIMSEGYKNAVDVAVQTVQAGLTDYNSAIRKAMKAAAQEGLRVQYPNSGLTRRLDTAIRQNVLDGIRSINQDVLKQAGKEFGADGVEISAHALCAQDHLPYQGRQFEQKEFDRLQNNLDRPFGMWNCKHTVFPILVGISEPAHTEEELQAYIRNSNEEITIDGKTMSRYEWTQHQRKLETAVRYQKDIAVAAKAAGDMIARREAQAKINRLTEEYAKISDAAGLIEKPERMRVAGFNRVKTADQLKNPIKHGIIPSSGALDANSKEADRHAKQYYAAVRKMTNDCNRISNNVGWKLTAIERIKSHIFFDEHIMYGEKGRFYPSYHMAQSWQRLIQGGKEIREQDLVLLKHEYLEAILEAKGLSHEDAHAIATSKHDYAKYTR